MEIKKLSKTQIEALRRPLDAKAVSKHPTKTYLSSIKAIYVVERLNEVFGIGSWRLISEIIDNKSAMIVVKSKLIIPEYSIEIESYGGNDNGGENSKNFDLGDAYKGATTDALTKICSFLEIGMQVFKGLGNIEPIKKEVFNEKHVKFIGALKAIQEGSYTLEQLKNKYDISEQTIKLIQDKIN